MATLETGVKKYRPDVRAALVVSPVVVILEILSDVIPGIGYVLTVPIAVVTYYVQGVLAGRYLREDPRYANAGAGEYARRGALSAVWTGIVLSNAVTLIDFVILTPLSFGAILIGLPLVLASSLTDMVLNLVFTTLGAWLYGRLGSHRMWGISCILMGIVVIFTFILGVAAAVGLVWVGYGAVRGMLGR
ncbi:MAG: hypothetical protein M1281_17700 [Chloroflexi bacterium]|nr:hypothetical protein [Chloroflexota bacterium]